MVYVDLEQLPGTKIYKLPDDMPLRLGALSEPLTSCIRAFSRAPADRRLPLGRHGGDPGLGADRRARRGGGAGDGRRARDRASARRSSRASRSAAGSARKRRSNLEEDRDAGGAHRGTSATSSAAIGADLVMDCSGHPVGRARGHRDAARRRHLRRDGPVHRRRRDLDQLAPDLHQGPQRARLLGVHRQRPAARASPCSTARATAIPGYEMQTLFPFTEDGPRATRSTTAIAMRTVKSTIVPFEGLG